MVSSKAKLKFRGRGKTIKSFVRVKVKPKTIKIWIPPKTMSKSIRKQILKSLRGRKMPKQSDAKQVHRIESNLCGRSVHLNKNLKIIWQSRRRVRA